MRFYHEHERHEHEVGPEEGFENDHEFAEGRGHRGRGRRRFGPGGFGPGGFGPGGFGPGGPGGFGPGGRGFGPGFGSGFGSGRGFAPGFGPGRFPPGFGPGRRGGGGPGFRPGGPGGPEGPEAHGFGPGGPGFGPGFGPGRGFGPRGGGFGPGFGPGGFGPGRFGPGMFGPGGPGRGKRGRGNVRAAVLALLAEEPRHGYAIMTELTERSGGLWKPSPGSVYPVLQQLQDEGLVSVEESEGRRVFSLTDAGRSYVTEHADELREPWKVAEHGPRQRVQGLMYSATALAAAVEQVARLADDAQAAQAVAVLEDARKAMYRILAGDADPLVEEPGTGSATDG